MISEVFTDGNPNTQFVEIRNDGGAALLMTGFGLCKWPNYWQFPVFSLPAGARVVVHWNQTGINTATDLYTGAIGGDLSTASGEFGLYDCNAGCVPPGCWGTASCMRDYLEWGASGHTRSGVAHTAGIWSSGDFAAAMSGGLSLTLSPGNPGDLGCHYVLAVASPGS